ncbi:hypothetical protein T484DRAFT_1783325, partial [Baffinella frigidus]
MAGSMAAVDEAGGFEGALNRWAGAHSSGATALGNLVSGLEEFAGAQRRWEDRRAALGSMGIETGCVDWRKRIDSEEAGGVLQAEKSLRRVQQALDDLRTSVADMWVASACALDKVGLAESGAAGRMAVVVAEELSVCAAKHGEELRLR